MRRLLSSALLVFGAAVAVLPASAQSIIDRPPMDLGADQIGTITQVGQDILYPPHRPNTWWELGMAYPIGTLQDANLDPGLMIRANQRFWNDDTFGLVASLGILFSNDSYFNDAQEDIAFGTPPASPFDPLYPYTGVDIQSRYFWTVPAMVDFEIAPRLSEGVQLNLSAGPGIAWSHDAVITSAVNNGVGGEADSGTGGEQGISPYAIRTRTRFNLGWDAKAGIGFKVSSGTRPLWVRAQVSGVTYYNHTAPRTILGFTASFGR
ncbi:MAG: hypothetical protein ACREOU_00185 [Candidatus Eiseniibacteriota bacterium]